MVDIDREFREAATYFTKNRKLVKDGIERWLGKTYEEDRWTICEDCGVRVKNSKLKQYIDRTGTTKVCKGCKDIWTDQQVMIRERDIGTAATTSESSFSPSIDPFIQASQADFGGTITTKEVIAAAEIAKLQAELLKVKEKLKSKESNLPDVDQSKRKRRIEL